MWWQSVIGAAEQWHYGRELAINKEVILFIQFVIKKYQQHNYIVAKFLRIATC
ncbi:MAG: hypothetical protein ACYC2U_05750 [Candidatus Amoebophilus sp.]